jgi:iron complex transport system permease protein
MRIWSASKGRLPIEAEVAAPGRHRARFSSERRLRGSVLPFYRGVAPVGIKEAQGSVADSLLEGQAMTRSMPRLLAGIPLGVLGGLTVALLALIAAAALIGAYPLTLSDIAQAVGRRLAGAPPRGRIDTVLFEVRLPRVFAAVLVGAALAAAGAAYQTLFRNPLVSPDILGVSTGAGLGAVFGIFLSLPVAGIQLAAFIMGLATVGLVYAIASVVHGREPLLVLVLAGVVVGALAGAAISLLKILADPYDQLPAIVFWLLGSLSAIRKGEVWSATPLVVAALVPLVLLRWRINVLSLGDEEAKALGVEAGRLRLFVIAAATLMTASVVAISGVIGWLGLVIPHIARMLVGPSFDRLLPTAMLLGGGYLLLVDTLARSMARIEVPIGILTAVIGAPFFLWLLARGREGWS